MSSDSAADPRKRVCVFLLQLGGPERIEEIEPFLRNLFEDVLPVPRLLRRCLARRIARRRAPRVAPLYQELGGGSPLRRNTDAQAAALSRLLNDSGFEAQVLVCMRYAPPRAVEALEVARRDWSDATWVVLPLYPQYSLATTGSSMDELHALLTTAEQARLLAVTAYPAAPRYLDSMAALLQESLGRLSAEERAGAHLLFSAHSLPMSLVRKGDPYPEHVEQTVRGVLERLASPPPHHVSFQSRVGPVRWLGPETVASVRELGAAGVRTLVVVPVSFVSEHVETLHELDVQLAAVAREAGITRFERTATPGEHPAFIEALASQVRHALPRDEQPDPTQA